MARGSASTGRVPSRSARVKNSLKLAYAVGFGFHRVGHVGLEAAHEQPDQRVLERRRARARRGEHQP